MGWNDNMFIFGISPRSNFRCETNKIKTEDEWNTEEICDAFIKNKRIIVRATLPGCGKSHACQKMKDRGRKTLFVCPTDKLLIIQLRK